MKRSIRISITMCSLFSVLLGARGAFCAEATPLPVAAKDAAVAEKASGEKGGKGMVDIPVSIKAPLFSPLFAKIPVAKVDDETLTLSDITRNLDALNNSSTEQGGHKKQFSDLLDRLITVKLMVEEARRMELDQRPEVAELLRTNRNMMIKEALIQDLCKNIKVDEKEVARLLADIRREVKLEQIEFGDRVPAQKFLDDVRKGKDFEKLASSLVAAKIASRSTSGEFLRLSGVNDEYRKVLKAMKVGELSPVVKNLPTYAVLRLVEIRDSDDPLLKEKARSQFMSMARRKLLAAESERLFRKHMHQNMKLIKSLDLEAKKPGIEKLLTDKRVLVTSPGEKPITVADLVKRISDGFTHGMDRAIKEKKANQQIIPTLKVMMSVIANRKESEARGLDKTPAMREKLARDEETTLFGAFVELVLKPEVKIGQKELQAYYDSHASAFSVPVLVKLQSVGFKSKASAQKALEKLREGIDLKWVQSNSDDLLPPDSPGILEFDTQMAPLPSLPEGVQKALAKANGGEYRLYESPEKYYYVLYLERIIPARQKSLGEAANEIVPATYELKFNQQMEEWAKKLRAAADVEVYANF